MQYSLELEKQLVEAEEEISQLKAQLHTRSSSSKHLLPHHPQQHNEEQEEIQRLRDEVTYWKKQALEREVALTQLRSQLSESHLKYQIACDIQQVNLTALNIGLTDSPKACSSPKPSLMRSSSNVLRASMSKSSSAFKLAVDNNTAPATTATATSAAAAASSSRPSSSYGNSTKVR